MTDQDKRAAAEAAVEEVRDGMLVGLGTGSTAAHAIALLGVRVARGLAIATVATSIATERLARQAGLDVIDFGDVERLDLTIDGTDEIDDRFFAIKGAGGAMLREKIVARASDRMIVVADGSKRVTEIGAAKLPVEVLPFAESLVARLLGDLGGKPALRLIDGRKILTDQGNIIIDCAFGVIADPPALAAVIGAIPGVMGHGLFLSEVDAAYIASGGTVTRLERGDVKD